MTVMPSSVLPRPAGDFIPPPPPLPPTSLSRQPLKIPKSNHPGAKAPAPTKQRVKRTNNDNSRPGPARPGRRIRSLSRALFTRGCRRRACRHASLPQPAAKPGLEATTKCTAESKLSDTKTPKCGHCRRLRRRRPTVVPTGCRGAGTLGGARLLALSYLAPGFVPALLIFSSYHMTGISAASLSRTVPPRHISSAHPKPLNTSSPAISLVSYPSEKSVYCSANFFAVFAPLPLHSNNSSVCSTPLKKNRQVSTIVRDLGRLRLNPQGSAVVCMFVCVYAQSSSSSPVSHQPAS